MYYTCSDEDTDIKALVRAWMITHGTSNNSLLESWLEDYFYLSLSWVIKTNEFVVDTSLVGVALNGLSHLKGVTCKAEFVSALVRGLAGNLHPSNRETLAKDLFQRAHEIPPNAKRILDTYYDQTAGCLSTHQLEVSYR